MKLDWRSPLDIGIVLVIVVTLALTSVVLGPVSLLMGTFFHDAILGVLVALLMYWVYFRLWWLMRQEGGPSVLLAWSIGASLLAMLLHTETGGLILNTIPFVAPLDTVAFDVRLAALVLLGAALIAWKRIPNWVGWIEAGYAALFVGQSPSDDWVWYWLRHFLWDSVPTWITQALWILFLAALSVVLLVDALSVHRDSGAVLDG